MIVFPGSAYAEQNEASEIIIEEEDLSGAESPIQLSDFTLPGVHYYTGMPVIETKKQLDYELSFSEFSIQNNVLRVNGTITHNGEEIHEVVAQGELIVSGPETQFNKGNVVAMLHSENELSMLSCLFEKEPYIARVFPVNMEFEGNPTLTFVVKTTDDVVLNFSAMLPETFDIDTLISNARLPEKDVNVEVDLMKNPAEGMGEVPEEFLEEDAVRMAADFHTFTDLDAEAVEIDEEATIADYNSKERAVSPVEGVPANVFTQIGSWASTNNPSCPQAGYYAITWPHGGSASRETHLIRWSYGYSTPNVIDKNNRRQFGTTYFKIETAAQYLYTPHNGKIEQFWTNLPEIRIKNAAMIMGLSSKEQILSGAITSFRVNKVKIKVDWKTVIGFLPYGKQFNDAISLFNAIKYSEEVVGPIDNPSGDRFQDTANGQMNVDGALIRSQKVATHTNWLMRTGDYLSIDYYVRSPEDLGMTKGKKNIYNKYYFEVYGRDAWGLYRDRLRNVTEYRTSHYEVK